MCSRLTPKNEHMTDRNKPPQPSSTKLPRDASGRLILGDAPPRRQGREPEPYWLNTTCGHREKGSLCGLRQFRTWSGDTCAAGHGGAEGMTMGSAELSTWELKHGDEPVPWSADDAPLDDGGTRHGSLPGGFYCTEEDMKSEPKMHDFGPGDLDVGDIVILCSGGPAMTVLVGNKGCLTVECVWFDKSGVHHRDSFHVHTLRMPRFRPGDPRGD